MFLPGDCSRLGHSEKAHLTGHGDEADQVAAVRADSFLDAGDLNRSAAWQLVLRAIKEIRREEPRAGESQQRVLPMVPASRHLGTSGRGPRALPRFAFGASRPEIDPCQGGRFDTL